MWPTVAGDQDLIAFRRSLSPIAKAVPKLIGAYQDRMVG